MRGRIPLNGPVIALIFWIIASFAGCEETLEVCAPCGTVEGRDVTVSGDPRLDGMIEAVQRIRRLAEQSVTDFASDVAALGEAFGVASADASSLTAAIRAQLFENPDLTVTSYYEPARCWVDSAAAETGEFSCEKRLGCLTPNAKVPQSKCVGLFVGDCEAYACQGTCYAPIEGEDLSCPGECVGTCGQIASFSCPGVCLGDCSSDCSAYNADGECFGHCPGLCTGACESRKPFPCGGMCYGLCQSEMIADTGCTGTCYGTCVDRKGNNSMGDGLCRGHVWPGGVNDECAYCKETASSIAWSLITCDPAEVSIAVAFSESFDQSREQVLAKVRTLERALERAAEAHAKLSLLADGVDDAAEQTPEDLVDPVDAEAAGVDDAGLGDMALEARPLWSIKERVSALRDTATSGEFTVAAGALPCVGPAFEEAYQIMDGMIPDSQGSSSSRDCSGQSPDSLAPCLYETIDGQAALLDLVTPTN